MERDCAERRGDFVELRRQPVVGHHVRDGGARGGVERQQGGDHFHQPAFTWSILASLYSYIRMHTHALNVE